MGTFITAIILIIAFLLGAVILVQNPKGGGLAAGFTGGASMGGVQRTTDFLEKGTWILAISLLVLCLISTAFTSTTVVEEQTSDLEGIIDNAVVPSAGFEDSGAPLPNE